MGCDQYGERVLRDFFERVCTEYSSLLHTQAPNYRDRLNVVLTDAQTRGDYLGGCCVPLGESRQILHVSDANCDDERGGSTPSSPHDGDMVDVPPPPESTNLLHFLLC